MCALATTLANPSKPSTLTPHMKFWYWIQLLFMTVLLTSLQPAYAQGPATGYTQIDVVHRSPIKDSPMQFAGSGTLNAEVKIAGVNYSASIVVEGNTKTREQAAKDLAAALKDELPQQHKDKVKQSGATITVSGTDAGKGTGDKPHQHPNSGGSVNTNRARTTQFSGK
jgi:hypothetical protein